MMKRDDVKVKKCYRLGSGQIVRIMSIQNELVRCDMFDETERKWVQLASALPITTLKEPCPEPPIKH
jgi:uncharacterized protein (UPF0179 family)